MTLTAKDGETYVSLRVVPNASHCRLLRGSDGGLRLRVDAPARDGAANKKVIRTVAALLGVARREVRIVQGARGRDKVLGIALPIEEVRKSLLQCLVGDA